MLKKFIISSCLLCSSLLWANEHCSNLQTEIEMAQKVNSSSILIFNEEFKKVEQSTLECSEVTNLIERARKIIYSSKEIKEKAVELKNNCGIVIPVDDTDVEVSLKLHYIHFYKIINCDKTDINK